MPLMRKTEGPAGVWLRVQLGPVVRGSDIPVNEWQRVSGIFCCQKPKSIGHNINAQLSWAWTINSKRVLALSTVEAFKEHEQYLWRTVDPVDVWELGMTEVAPPMTILNVQYLQAKRLISTMKMNGKLFNNVIISEFIKACTNSVLFPGKYLPRKCWHKTVYKILIYSKFC
jgi:hypothetical protein